MNPHTRYEVPIAKVPRGTAIVVLLLMMFAIAGVAYLVEQTPGEVIPRPKIVKPQVPDVHAAIQKAVDAHNPFLQVAEVQR